jgi:hypothetical protein
LNAAFVYRTSPPSDSIFATLSGPDATDGDGFGKAVSLSRRGTWIVVGAPYRDEDGLTNKGAVYIFSNLAGQWSYHSKLTSNRAVANDRFGWSVSVDDSTSTGGIVRVLVGCNFHTDYSGFVEVFDLSSGLINDNL